MDELLDLVNEKDEVIGVVSKDEANRDPKLIHREIAVCLMDSRGRMLMQQRSFDRKVYPGYWTETCAGHVLKGENPEKAAHRELVEEIGFDTQLKLIEKDINYFPHETFFGYGYIGSYNGEIINVQKEEVCQVKHSKC